MNRLFKREAIAIALISGAAAWMAPAMAETRIHSVQLDTAGQKLVIEGAEFNRTYVELGGLPLQILPGASATYVEASYAAAYPSGLTAGEYQVFVVRNEGSSPPHQGPADRRASYSLTIAASGGGSAAAYCFASNTSGQSFGQVNGWTVPLPHEQVLSGCTSNGTALTVTAAGVYEIRYQATLAAAVTADFYVDLDGTAVPGTTDNSVGVGVARATYSGAGIVAIAAGSTLRLRLATGPDVTYLQPDTGTHLTLVKLQ